ncbi:MAG: hypothetical protein Q8P50_01575 [Bacillota bacterium]|nr:hypothetical protein [Bacillota bacterium]
MSVHAVTGLVLAALWFGLDEGGFWLKKRTWPDYDDPKRRHLDLVVSCQAYTVILAIGALRGTLWNRLLEYVLWGSLVSDCRGAVSPEAATGAAL